MSEWEKRLEQPSVPLVAKGPPGPPKIVEIEKKYDNHENFQTLTWGLLQVQTNSTTH